MLTQYLHSARLGLYASVIVWVCDMTPVCTGQQSHPFLLSLIYSLGTFLLF